jgi:16S rRNA (guanine966-N2)-methyltransferase
MRIIAGEFRGRRLLPPEGDVTRPITDRVKQSLFDILTPLLPGARVYDCFAGTGSMGLESISRGAAEAVFFEADRSAQTRLRKNIAALGVEDRCRVIGQDLFRWFASAAPPKPPIGVVYLDPPYRFLRERPDDLRKLAERLSAHVAPEGTIVFRHDVADRLELPGLSRADERTYGGMTIEFLRTSS